MLFTVGEKLEIGFPAPGLFLDQVPHKKFREQVNSFWKRNPFA
jgi:hypothetical protein